MTAGGRGEDVVSRVLVLAFCGVLALGAPAARADTVSCDGKRGWQRAVVLDSVHRWFAQEPRPDALLELVQAEHGIVACSSSPFPPMRLHTTMLPHGLELDHFGALLLVNELEWAGLIARPEEGLAGRYFRVRRPGAGERARTEGP